MTHAAHDVTAVPTLRPPPQKCRRVPRRLPNSHALSWSPHHALPCKGLFHPVLPSPPPTPLPLIPGGCVPRVRAEPRIWHHITVLSVSQTELVTGPQYQSSPSSLCQDGHRHPSCCAQASLTPEVTGRSLFPSQSLMSQGSPFVSETDHPCPTAFDCIQVCSSLTSPDLHPVWPPGLPSITCSS